MNYKTIGLIAAALLVSCNRFERREVIGIRNRMPVVLETVRIGFDIDSTITYFEQGSIVQYGNNKRNKGKVVDNLTIDNITLYRNSEQEEQFKTLDEDWNLLMKNYLSRKANPRDDFYRLAPLLQPKSYKGTRAI